MLPSKYIHLIVALLLTLVAAPAHAGISWGTFLGADWADAEGELAIDVDTKISNPNIIMLHNSCIKPF